jgi:hypothetical protein
MVTFFGFFVAVVATPNRGAGILTGLGILTNTLPINPRGSDTVDKLRSLKVNVALTKIDKMGEPCHGERPHCSESLS